MKECIQITKRYEIEGLGKSKKKMNDVWWENTYNSVLSKINSTKTETEENIIEEEMEYDCKGNRIIRTRSRSVSFNNINQNIKNKENKEEKETEENKNQKSLHRNLSKELNKDIKDVKYKNVDKDKKLKKQKILKLYIFLMMRMIK